MAKASCCHNNKVELWAWAVSTIAQCESRMPLSFHLKVTKSFNIIINTTPTTNKYIIKKIIIFSFIFCYTIISALPLNQLISTIHRNTRQMGCSASARPSLPVLACVLAPVGPRSPWILYSTLNSVMFTVLCSGRIFCLQCFVITLSGWIIV